MQLDLDGEERVDSEFEAANFRPSVKGKFLSTKIAEGLGLGLAARDRIKISDVVLG